jgi:predicted SnoaL-like aldol condensation-catalyzing enzyme
MTNKQSAINFLQMVVEGKIDEAYETYIDMDGKHHNIYFPAGFPELKNAMKENHIQFPHKKLIVKHALADGDFVAIHSHVIHNPGEEGAAVVHLFRFHNNKIAEMWDCGQQLNKNSPNTDGAF